MAVIPNVSGYVVLIVPIWLFLLVLTFGLVSWWCNQLCYFYHTPFYISPHGERQRGWKQTDRNEIFINHLITYPEVVCIKLIPSPKTFSLLTLYTYLLLFIKPANSFGIFSFCVLLVPCQPDISIENLLRHFLIKVVGHMSVQRSITNILYEWERKTGCM